MAEQASKVISTVIAMHCEKLKENAEKKATEIMKEMQADIEQNTPPPYPYRKKHMRGGWKTSVKRFGGGEYISYGVYNRNVPQLVHLVEKGHRIVAGTMDTGGYVPGRHFVDPARDKAREKLNEEISKLVEDFNDGK